MTVFVLPQQAAPPKAEHASQGQAAPAGLRVDLLHAFVTLAEELHFTRASSRLFLSPSGLSRRIRMLEGVLGVELLQRTTRVVDLTTAGEALLPHARAILQSAEAATVATRRASL
jgi:DNA-binding transcriptional LysR family regulator